MVQDQALTKYTRLFITIEQLLQVLKPFEVTMEFIQVHALWVVVVLVRIVREVG